MSLIRLDRMLSGMGEGTRSKIKALVRSGAVRLNGTAVKAADIKIDTEKDSVFILERRIVYKEHVYIMLNKPGGIVSASRDPKARTVIDLLPVSLRRPGLFPAGRLDKDTEGMLIITDDGVFAHNILSPSRHVQKRYFALLEFPVSDSDIEAFESGIILDDGYACMPAKLEKQDDGVVVTIQEGKYHQIKRMFEARENAVLYLKRIAVGGLRLDDKLKLGQSRELDAADLSNI